MAAKGISHNAYKQVDVETASQGKLIVLLFNGAIQRAEEARRLMLAETQDIQGIHNNLVRAQDIVSELRTALDMSAGEIAENLDRSYEYFYHLLVQANLNKEPKHIEEAVELMTILRDTWQEVFEKEEQASESPKDAPRINQHGNSMLNLKG